MTSVTNTITGPMEFPYCKNTNVHNATLILLNDITKHLESHHHTVHSLPFVPFAISAAPVSSHQHTTCVSGHVICTPHLLPLTDQFFFLLFMSRQSSFRLLVRGTVVRPLQSALNQCCKVKICMYINTITGR